MPDFSQLLGMVRWEVVLGLSVVPIVLQFLAAIIHPVVFNLVSFATIAGIIAVGVLDGMNAADQTAYHAQLVEMGAVALVVFIGHLIIRRLFLAMSRASRPA